MIKEAITVLKERTGSSAHAIAKYMEEKHGAALPANYKKMLSIQLRGFASKGKLVKVKASYKLSDAAKDSPKAKPAAPAPKAAAPKPAKDAASLSSEKPRSASPPLPNPRRPPPLAPSARRRRRRWSPSPRSLRRRRRRPSPRPSGRRPRRRPARHLQLELGVWLIAM